MNAASIQSELEHAFAAMRAGTFTRVLVLDEIASTQDAAREHCHGAPGLMVMAINQTSGRGRLGRRWVETPGLGLAATFVLPGDLDPGRVSMLCGLAACLTCEAALDVTPGPGPTTSEQIVDGLHFLGSPLLNLLTSEREKTRIGLRWPNDVVEADSDGRKLAGVLIERSGGLNFAGIGINVRHRLETWSPELINQAVSLTQLGSRFSVVQTAALLIASLDRLIAASDDTLRQGWYLRNVLRGRTCTFHHNGETFSGVVRAIHPTSHIELLDPRRGLVTLPALTTSLVHS